MTTIASVRVSCLLVVLAACGRSAPTGVNAPPAGSGNSSVSGERGMKVEPTPVTLEVTPRLRGSRDIILRSGDHVVSRDKIRIEVKASLDAHLYLGYCDRDRKLAIFPEQGSIEARAGETTFAPDRDRAIALDDQTGPEVLYVIASRRRLELADPELAQTIFKARPGAASVECGAQLKQVLEKKKPPPAPPQPRSPEPVKGDRISRLPPPSKAERYPALERGGYITSEDTGEVSASGDRDGIVVLRYSFTHVDKLPPP